MNHKPNSSQTYALDDLLRILKGYNHPTPFQSLSGDPEEEAEDDFEDFDFDDDDLDFLDEDDEDLDELDTYDDEDPL